MATPAWFEEDYYLNQKLAQLAAQDPANWKGKTTNDVKAAFDEAGFTPYTHFEAFGNSVDENISPTSQFDINFYLAAKSLELNDRVYQGKSDWTPEKVMQAFKDAGMTAWDHYQQFGFMEDIAPNENFDSGKYFLAKVAELNSTNYEGRSDWTVAEVKQAFKDAGLTPVEHYAEYGKAENVDSYATGNADFTKVDNAAEINKVVEDSGYNANTGAKDYALADALAAKADGTLSKVYNLTADADGNLDAGEVNVAQYKDMKALISDALNSDDYADATPVYTLNDTLANLQDAPAAALKGSNVDNSIAHVIVTDSTGSKGILDANNDLNTVGIDALLGTVSGTASTGQISVEYHLIGTSKGDNLSIQGMLTRSDSSPIPGTITMLAGGDGADVVFGSEDNDVLFAGGFSEKVDDVYAESQQSAIAAGSTIPAGFQESIAQYVDTTVVNKYFANHNILDGRAGANDLVASNQTDTFLVQLGGKGSGSSTINGIDPETPGTNTIHQFKVGQDYLFIMDQSDRSLTGDKLDFMASWGKDAVNSASTLQWQGDKLTLTIKADFLNGFHTDLSGKAIPTDSNDVFADVTDDLIITFVGIQNASTSTTAADILGLA